MSARFDGGKIALKEVHRFENGPIHAAGRMYWDVLRLWSEIQSGLRAAAERDGANIVSVGVDTWGVDFALLGADGLLLANPFHYRDPHTTGIMQDVLSRVSRESIFERSGLQFMPINTLYQLVAMHRAGSPALSTARRFLMIPDVFHWLLTGEATNEFTNATTTQFFNPREHNWSKDLLTELGIDSDFLQDVIAPGSEIGPLTAQVQSDTGLAATVRVIAPGTHDTASAVVAVPAETSEGGGSPNWCYLSSGTWSLMGVESQTPIINEDCLRLNFTNEGGVDGTWRVLKNIAGLWLLQECRRVWQSQGHSYEWESLCEMADSAPALRCLINPDDSRFVAPRDMPAEIAAACRDAGQPSPENHAGVIRCALESLALKYRQVLGWLEQLTGETIETIHIVGGGANNAVLNQATADACGRRVLAGPSEATALGNALVQATTAGAIGNIAQAREIVGKSYKVCEFAPRNTAKPLWDEAFGRFVQLSREPI